MDNFESLLEKEITDSIKNHPELWNTSIMGLKRNDGLDLNIGLFESCSDISIHSPYKYVFKDDKIKKRLWKITSNLRSDIYEKKKRKEDIDCENKLSEFLNLDSRKNKLKKLQNISSKLKNTSDTNKEKNESLFKRLLNKLI